MGAPAERLRSLDAARGLTVMLMIAVNTAAYIHYVNDFKAYPGLLHAHWAGFTFADSVFPAFAFLIGVSVAVARRPDARPGAVVGHALSRALKLILLGLLISNLYVLADFDTLFRPMGVLQRLAVVSLTASMAVLYLGPRTRLAIAVAILALYWPLCLIPTPDGVATDLSVRGKDFVAWFDRWVLGPYRYVEGPEGYDPEGLLSTLPAIAQGLLGVALGEYVLRTRGKAGSIRNQALGGAALVGAGLVWGLWFPVIKDIWTSSFVLVSSGVATLVFALMRALFDRPGVQAPVPVLTAFGMNAIAAYVLHEFAAIILAGDMMKAPYWFAAQFLPAQAASLAPVLVFIALIWAPMAYMLKRGWFVKL